MASNILITFNSNPSVYAELRFYIKNDTLDVPFSVLILKQLISYGTPVSTSQIAIGATTADTVANIVANLNLHNNMGFITYEVAASNQILISFAPPGAYYWQLDGTPGDWDFNLNYFEVPVETFPALENTDDIAIEIYDTYENDRPLIDEVTQVSSPRLSWDSGDDGDEALMTSKLTFNMFVRDAADGTFYHLFTGDEQRYRVEVHSVNDEEEKIMIWQGFLLPDLQTEPYINGAFPVEFTAVDMIASLKGKTLEPWFYNNRIPITKVLAYCLQNTGLIQDFIVSPSVIPGNNTMVWKDITVPLGHYADEKKLTDCYTILVDILETNQLTLYSFRGVWFVKGITRKHEVINQDSFYFDENGVFVKYIDVENKVSEPIQLRELPMISALSPWKKVNVEVSQELSKSILPEDVVVLNSEHLKSINETNALWKADLYNGYYNYFTKVGPLFASSISVDNFSFKFNQFSGIYASQYSVTEPIALNNYFECKVKPYLAANEEYEFEIEGFAKFWTGDPVSTGWFEAFDVYFKYGFVFQLLIDGVEVVSNRPSFFDNHKFIVKYQEASGDQTPYLPNGLGTINYKLKTTFSTNLEGPLTVRILFPIYNGSYVYSYYEVRELNCTVLKITPVKNVDKEYENCHAARPINFTQEKDLSIKFTSSKNESILNNFGINRPTVADFFPTVSVVARQEKLLKQNTVYSPSVTTTTGLVYYTTYHLGTAFSPFNFQVFETLFGYKLLRKNLFLTRGNGDEEAFPNVLATKIGPFAFISDLDLSPNIPKNYGPYNDLDPELATPYWLRYMDVKYGVEDVEKRASWKVYGYPTLSSFVQAVAKACHFVRPEPLYSLETTFLQCVFPNELIQFNYYGELRNFIPTRLEIDLFNGITTAKNIEAKLHDNSDITYE